MLERFLREGAALSALNHPHIVRVLDVREAERRPFLVCEYVSRGTLRQELLRDGRLTNVRAMQVLREMLCGLEACHQRGIVYRDVKPENVLFTTDRHAKIGDLGVAKFCGAKGTALTSTGVLIGTPRYMSPEQQVLDYKGRNVYLLGGPTKLTSQMTLCPDAACSGHHRLVRSHSGWLLVRGVRA